MDKRFWRGKRVFLTGHTGFKGGWLTLWLRLWGAETFGYALAPNTAPCLYEAAGVAEAGVSDIGDVRDYAALLAALMQSAPEVVFHLAAQPLVRYSYKFPRETYETNVMGLVNLLSAAREVKSIKSIVVVTSDKCYENREWVWGYRENEPMGGHDPYSSSKGCAELVTAAMRNSFFSAEQYASHGVAVASARAGNVLGGGDWSEDRLIPDIVRSFLAGEAVRIRNPNAIRPWQHVLEPLAGYLLLAEKLTTAGVDYAAGWNFGPDDADARTVSWIVERLTRQWPGAQKWHADQGDHPHEAGYLKLDSSKARTLLGWRPRLDLDTALAWSSDWYQAHARGERMREITIGQIEQYCERLGS